MYTNTGYLMLSGRERQTEEAKSRASHLVEVQEKNGLGRELRGPEFGSPEPTLKNWTW